MTNWGGISDLEWLFRKNIHDSYVCGNLNYYYGKKYYLKLVYINVKLESHFSMLIKIAQNGWF